MLFPISRRMSLVRPRHPPGFTLLELIVVLAIIAVLFALLLPAVPRARDSGWRAACSNNLHQIGIALHQYHDANGSLPFGVTAFEAPLPSWHVQLLPYLEQQALADEALRWAHYSAPPGPPLPNPSR
jgi:prepilin-type N-terminal cleavage/methylation domain-containing protein